MNQFTPHSIETAPERSGLGLRAAEQKLGFIPNMMAVLAESPAALEAYQAIQGAFATSSFSAAEQNFLALAISVANGCDYCVPAYTVMALKTRVPEDVVTAVRDGTPIKDPRFSILREFALAVVEKRGRVPEAEVEAFLGAGFTKAQVLEVIVAAAFKMISNYTNHIAHIPLDEAFRPHRWEGLKAA